MTVEIADNSLNILESAAYDNSIESFQYYDHTPQSQHNLDQLGSPIQIDIHANDEYINPSKSYILIKGQLVKTDDTVYNADDEVALVNNAMMYLFSEIKYSIGGTIMERIANPGQVTSMLGYLSYPDDYSTSAGLKSCWSKDTTNHAVSKKFNQSQAAPAAGYTPVENGEYNQGFAVRKSLLMDTNPRGSFSFVIPFEHIFGFSEYDKVIYGVKHSLTFTRNSTDNLAIYHANGVTDGKINIKSLTWRVPHAKIETLNLMKMREIIESKQSIPVVYRGRHSESTYVTPAARSFDWRLSVTGGIEKPRWIIVGFQTNRNTTQEQNPAVLDHVNLTNVYATLNNERYPITDLTTSFATNDFSVLYEMLDNLKKYYYGFNSLVGGTQVNFPAFKSLYPIIVLDITRQSERLKSGVVDMQLKFFFENGVPADTIAYATIISDRLFKLASNGKNLTMVSY